MKLSPQSHILFYKDFLDLEHSNPAGKYLWQELLKSPQGLIFFLTPLAPQPFSKFGTESSSQQKGGADTVETLKKLYQ